jgi:hypothetical protein
MKTGAFNATTSFYLLLLCFGVIIIRKSRISSYFLMSLSHLDFSYFHPYFPGTTFICKFFIYLSYLMIIWNFPYNSNFYPNFRPYNFTISQIWSDIKGSFERIIQIQYRSMSFSSSLVHRVSIKFKILLKFRISLISTRVSVIMTVTNFDPILFVIKNTMEHVRFVRFNFIRVEQKSRTPFIDELEQILEISSYFTQIY